MLCASVHITVFESYDWCHIQKTAIWIFTALKTITKCRDSYKNSQATLVLQGVGTFANHMCVHDAVCGGCVCVCVCVCVCARARARARAHIRVNTTFVRVPLLFPCSLYSTYIIHAMR